MTGKEFMNRVDYGLKQLNLARKNLTEDLGISSTMSSWAAGRGSIPNANLIEKIADYLGVSTDLLIKGKERDYEKFQADNFPLEYKKLAEDFLRLPLPFKNLIKGNLEAFKKICIEQGCWD